MVSSGLQDNPNDNWFYIRSIATGHVISCLSSKESLLRSQVYVCPLQTPNDNSLWKWEKTFLKNKATGLVLDIRKGRLRMMEDTEICLYNQKTEDESRNQQWGLRESIDDLGRKQKGTFIYSVYNQEWVLDIGQIDDQKGFNKLILFPSQTIDNDNQRWLIEYQSSPPLHHDEINNHHHHNDLFLSNTTLSSPSNSFIIDQQQQKQPSPTAVDAQSYHEFSTSSRSSSSADLSGLNFPYGLMPAKRGSQSSVNSLTNYKESHHMVYIQQNQSLSEKSIALAAAYETWQLWKKEQVDHSIDSTIPLKEKQDKIRSTLQSMARTEATKLLNDTSSNNNHQSIYNLVNRYIIQLYEQLPSTP